MFGCITLVRTLQNPVSRTVFISLGDSNRLGLAHYFLRTSLLRHRVSPWRDAGNWKVMACSRYGWNLGQGGSRQNYWVWPSRSWETGHSGFLKHQGQASLKAGLFNVQELRLKSISANCITYTWIIRRFKEKVSLLSALASLPLLAVCMLSRVPMDCSLASSSVHRIIQARILEWVGLSFSRGSSWSRDWTQVLCVSCTGRADSLPLHHPGSHAACLFLVFVGCVGLWCSV